MVLCVAAEMAKPRVLRLGTVDHATREFHTLSAIAELVVPKSTNRKEFIAECNSGALDGVVAVYRTFASVKITGRFDAELLKILPKSLRFISHNGLMFHMGAGYDQIDVNECTKKNIRVSNVPTAVDDATADTNMFLILGALRGYNPTIFTAREGNWQGSPQPRLGHDPQGKVLGILGMGGIGRNLMKKATVFGMRIQYYNRSKLSDELSGGANYVGFDELLATSDVLSLNLPLNPQTRHIISTKEFAKMKDGIVIVNTARGAVMDEAALVEALDSGKVWSCGLDVFEDEPIIHPGLLENHNVILLPHMGTYTVETQRKMELWCIGNVRMALETGRLKSPVNEQKNI